MTILIWGDDLMAVIKSLEKTYMLMSLGTPEYYRWKCGIPWRSIEE
jgi:hypothetical protein